MIGALFRICWVSFCVLQALSNLAWLCFESMSRWMQRCCLGGAAVRRPHASRDRLRRPVTWATARRWLLSCSLDEAASPPETLSVHATLFDDWLLPSHSSQPESRPPVMVSAGLIPYLKGEKQVPMEWLGCCLWLPLSSLSCEFDNSNFSNNYFQLSRIGSHILVSRTFFIDACPVLLQAAPQGRLWAEKVEGFGSFSGCQFG